jgi:hypothetical protein
MTAYSRREWEELQALRVTELSTLEIRHILGQESEPASDEQAAARGGNKKVDETRLSKLLGESYEKYRLRYAVARRRDDDLAALTSELPGEEVLEIMADYPIRDMYFRLGPGKDIAKYLERVMSIHASPYTNLVLMRDVLEMLLQAPRQYPDVVKRAFAASELRSRLTTAEEWWLFMTGNAIMIGSDREFAREWWELADKDPATSSLFTSGAFDDVEAAHRYFAGCGRGWLGGAGVILLVADIIRTLGLSVDLPPLRPEYVGKLVGFPADVKLELISERLHKGLHLSIEGLAFDVLHAKLSPAWQVAMLMKLGVRPGMTLGEGVETKSCLLPAVSRAGSGEGIMYGALCCYPDARVIALLYYLGFRTSTLTIGEVLFCHSYDIIPKLEEAIDFREFVVEVNECLASCGGESERIRASASSDDLVVKVPLIIREELWELVGTPPDYCHLVTDESEKELRDQGFLAPLPDEEEEILVRPAASRVRDE